MKLFENYIKNLNKAFTEIDLILTEEGIDYCIIGGSALSKYGYVRQTEDIDILIDREDKDKLDNLPIGYIRKLSSKSLKLHEPEVRIDVIYSGEKAGDSRGVPYGKPSTLSHIDRDYQVNVMDLQFLIIYKICSGLYGNRLKDFGDVQELIKANSLPKKYLNNKTREDIEAKYIEIWNLTKEIV